MTGARTRIVVLVAVVVGALVAAGVAAVADHSPDPPFDILSAEVVEEVDPTAPHDVTAREVRFRIELAGPVPTCEGSTARPLMYGFLVDADRDASTRAGVVPDESAWSDLGPEARITVRCDDGSNEYVQPAGFDCSVCPTADGANVIEITAPAPQLPSIDFHWIGFAQQEDAFHRLPGQPGHGRFTILERALN